MQVSFIIPLYNCLPLTRACVASLQATLPRGLEHEIILVDDGSTDGTREWLQTLAAPCRVILNDRNLGYAAANNRGAAVARGPLLALVNNDLLFQRGWLEPMLALHERLGARAGLVGNVQRAAATRRLDHTGIAINHKGKPEHERVWYPWPCRARRVAAVTGACTLIRRSLFLEHGGFDEGFMNGGEDVDLSFRLLAAGCVNAVALRSCVLHHVSASPGRKLRDEQNTRRLVEKWRPQLVQLGTRPWSWHFLATQWSGARDPDTWITAAGLLAYALHLRRRIPIQALVGMNEALDAEQSRWADLLPGSRTLQNTVLAADHADQRG
jgi:GT2 family glycosyltransferase